MDFLEIGAMWSSLEPGLWSVILAKGFVLDMVLHFLAGSVSQPAWLTLRICVDRRELGGVGRRRSAGVVRFCARLRAGGQRSVGFHRCIYVSSV